MGNAAVDQETDISNESESVENKPVETEESNFVEDSGEETTETEEIEEEGQEDAPQFTQHQLDSIVLKQKNKLNSKLDVVTDVSEKANTDLAVEKQRTKLLEIALAQAKDVKQAPAAPKPDDFDDGILDPDYIKKQEEHTQSIIQQQVVDQVAKSNKEAQEIQIVNEETKALEIMQTAHYERVKESKIKDYFKHEDVALEIFGVDKVNEFIKEFDKSHLILNYFGLPANREEAEQVSQLLKDKRSVVKGVAQIGAIIERELTLKSKPKQTIPDPDEDIQSTSSSKGKRGPKGATYT